MSQNMTKLQYSRSMSLNERPSMPKPISNNQNTKLEKGYQTNLGIENWPQTNQTLDREIGFIDPPTTSRSVGSNTSFENSYSDLADLDTNSSIRYDYNRKDIIRFWDIGGYNVVLDRCDNSHKLSLDLKEMIKERAELEKEHANLIKRWCDKWSGYLEKTKEYGKNMKSGWQAIITSGEKTSEIHLEIAKKLTEESDSPIKTIDRYNKDNYRRRTIKKYKLKKTHEFRQDFINAQKHWADLQKELKAKEKDYEKAVKMNKDQKRELNRMNSFKNEIKKYEPIYIESLKNVFENTQNFELDRMKTFVNVFKRYHDVFSVSWSESRFKSILKNLLNSIDSIKPELDLKKWSDNFGAGTKFNIVE